MTKLPKMYLITKITDLEGNDKTTGRYPLRIGRRLAFGIGDPTPKCQMAICYRPKHEDTYSGTLYTSRVQKVENKNGEMVVTMQNSIYYFQELEED